MIRKVMLFAVLGIAGCATVKAEHVLTGTSRARYAGAIKVVMDGAPLPNAYDEIGIVTATGGGNLASLPPVLDALQAEAASIGGDAVIRVRYDRGVNTATATGRRLARKVPLLK